MFHNQQPFKHGIALKGVRYYETLLLVNANVDALLLNYHAD